MYRNYDESVFVNSIFEQFNNEDTSENSSEDSGHENVDVDGNMSVRNVT